MTRFLAFSFFALMTSPAIAGSVSFSSYSLLVKHSFVEEIPLQEATEPLRSRYGLFLRADKTEIDGSDGETGVKELEITGFISGHKTGLDVFLEVLDPHDFYETSIIFQWQSTDSWTLRANRPNSILPAMTLQGNYVFRGEVETVLNNSIEGDPFSLTLFGGYGFQQIAIGESIFGNGGIIPLNTAFGLQYSAIGQTSGQVDAVFKIDYKFGGSTTSDWRIGKTLELVSVTFEDGTTPEDHGFDLIFDSGRSSPNLPAVSTVPEPNTFALLGIGGAALAGYGWRRKRRQVA